MRKNRTIIARLNSNRFPFRIFRIRLPKIIKIAVAT